MSAGVFIKSKYLASYDGTSVHPIRVQPETEALSINSVANTPPSGAISNPIPAVISRGRRSRGLIPRTVSIQAPATGQPTGYKPLGITTLPCLNEEIYAAAVAATEATTVTYLGVNTWKVVGTPRPELPAGI